MRVYYHVYPTCPSCHEPHNKGMPIEILGKNDLRCSSCGANFSNNVNMLSSGKFENTVKIVIKNEGKNAEKYLSIIPLVWKINPNPIESEYTRWIDNLNSGKFLVTWPWRNVKILSLLAIDYLIKNSSKKVVVVCNISSKSDDLEINCPSLKDTFEHLIYIQNEEKGGIEEKIRREMRSFDRRFVLKKNKVVHFVINRIGTPYRRDDISFDSIQKTKNRLIREIESDFGFDSVRNVEISTLDHPKNKHERTSNPDGFIDIKLEEREQWSGNLVYRKQWLWDVLLNSRKIKRLSKLVSVITSSEVMKNYRDDERLFLISSEIEPEFIFDFIEKINPDLVFIQNTDEFIKDVIFNGKKSRALFNYLENCDTYPVIMFSTEPEIRHLYRINYTRDFLMKYNITPHTWDSEIIIDKIRNGEKNSESCYCNPLSSRFDELSYGGKIPEVEYIQTKSPDDLDKIIEKISAIIDDESVKRDIIKYISDLKRSPLKLKGDYENPEVFKRKGFSLDKITYTYLMSILREKIEDDTKFEGLKEVFEKIYESEAGDAVNPLMNEIVTKVNELLRESESTVTVVVHGYDVKGTEKLLRGLGFKDYIPFRLSVCSWGNLSYREHELNNKTDHYVVSTLPPSLAYSIYFGNVSKFVFIGNEDNVRKIETIIRNRLTETRSRPIYLLDEDDSAPDLLKNTLDSLEIDSNEMLEDISTEVIVEFEEDVGHIQTSPVKSMSSHPDINAGEYAILVVDNNKRGMFIPLGASLFIKKDHRLSELQLSDTPSHANLKKELKDIEILVDKHGVYVSFRSIFTKFMMIYGKSIQFRNGPFEWNGFQELLEDASEWIRILEDAVKLYSEKKKIPYEEAEIQIAEYLSSLDLTAKNPDYIRSWWSSYEIVETEKGVIHLYRVEHPRGLNDIKKIYSGINKILSEIILDPAKAEKTYIASIIIQNFRRSLLKGQIEEISPSMRQLYYRLEREVKDLIQTSPIFRVDLIYMVELSKRVEPFRVMTNYGDFIKTSPEK
ncbi:MAG: hypothetical protein KKF44_01220 [Nanoarchaeota archaeon]|nr:hypothetical protein [Nanoarchaeota archaeon]